MVKNLPADIGDGGSIPRLGRSPGVGNGNPLQYYVPKSVILWPADSIELDVTKDYEIEFRHLMQEWYDEQ